MIRRCRAGGLSRENRRGQGGPQVGGKRPGGRPQGSRACRRLRIYTRQLMLLPAAILLALVAAAAGLFARRARLLYGLVRLGRAVDRTRDVPVRVEREVTVVLGQRKLLQ